MSSLYLLGHQPIKSQVRTTDPHDQEVHRAADWQAVPRAHTQLHRRVQLCRLIRRSFSKFDFFAVLCSSRGTLRSNHQREKFDVIVHRVEHCDQHPDENYLFLCVTSPNGTSGQPFKILKAFNGHCKWLRSIPWITCVSSQLLLSGMSAVNPLDTFYIFVVLVESMQRTAVLSLTCHRVEH